MEAANSNTPKGRLLVVDDTEYNRDMLARRLTRRGFEVDAVEDGYAALEALDTTDYALVLLDVMMPGIDGYEVLERVRENHPPIELPIIMVTAKDESADIVRALKLGANDYITKPIDFAVALARINTHLLVSQSQMALRDAHERMKNDLDAAADTQRRLLPADHLDDSRVALGWEYRPCDELGGDMLNVFRIDQDRIGLYILDVSGHGVRSALLSFAVSRSLSPVSGAGSTVFASSVDNAATPEQVAQRLNAEYSMMVDGGVLFTLIYGVLDLASGKFSYVSAGHPDPLLISGGETVTMLESAGGPPIGVIDEAVFGPHQIELGPGDRIVMVSDGVYEQFNEERKPFGWDRYLQQVVACGSKPVTEAAATLADAVTAWAGDREMQDDISVLAFDYRP